MHGHTCGHHAAPHSQTLPGSRPRAQAAPPVWLGTEHTDAAQPGVLTPDIRIPQREAALDPSPRVTAAHLKADLGKKNGFTRQKKSKGWMKHSAEQATPRSAWLTHR